MNGTLIRGGISSLKAQSMPNAFMFSMISFLCWILEQEGRQIFVRNHLKWWNLRGILPNLTSVIEKNEMI